MKKVKSKKADLTKLHEELETQVAREEKSGHDLEKLYEQMGTKRENIAHEKELGQAQLSQDQAQQFLKNPENLTRMLIAMGPQEMIRLEKAVERLEADPRYHFDPKDVKTTLKNLKAFSAQVYGTAKEIDEKFQRQQLIEKIKLEREKQIAIQGVISDLDTMSKASSKN